MPFTFGVDAPEDIPFEECPVDFGVTPLDFGVDIELACGVTPLDFGVGIDIEPVFGDTAWFSGMGDGDEEEVLKFGARFKPREVARGRDDSTTCSAIGPPPKPVNWRLTFLFICSLMYPVAFTFDSMTSAEPPYPVSWRPIDDDDGPGPVDVRSFPEPGGQRRERLVVMREGIHLAGAEPRGR